jgi:hypothetical protein
MGRENQANYQTSQKSWMGIADNYPVPEAKKEYF